MNIATAYVEVRAKDDKLKSDVVSGAKSAGVAGGKALEDGITEGAKRGAKGASSALGGLKDVFKGALFAGGLKVAIDQASDLNETISKSKVVFGDAAGAIEKYAQGSAKALGQSKQATIDAATGFAVFGKSAGLAGPDLSNFATKLTTLSSDMASFSNTSPEDAVIALSAAMRGESEPIRQYGVLLDDASLRQEALKQGLISTTTQALTPQQRVLAAYQLILKQTTDAQGDFARTADGAANSQRIAAAQAKDSAASFGEILLPIYTRAVQVVGFLAEGFGKLPAAVQVGLVGLAGLVAFSGPISSMVTLVQQIGPAIARGFAAIATGVTAINPAFLALAGVAAVAATAIFLLGNQESESDKIAKNLNATMRDSAKSFDEQAIAAGGATGTLAGYASQLDEINQKQIKQTIESKHQVDDLNRLNITYQELGKLTGSQADREEELTKLRKQLIDSGEVYIASTNDLTKSANLSAEAQQAVVEEFIRTGSVTNKVVDGQKLILQGNTELNGSYNDLAEAAKKNTDTLIEQAGAGDLAAIKVLQVRGELGLLSDAQRKNADAAIASADANKDAGTAIGGAGKSATGTSSTFQGLTKQTLSLKDQMDKAGDVASEFKDSLDRLTGTHISLDDAYSKAIEDQQGLAKAFKDARDAAKDNKGSLDEYTEAGRANREIIKSSIQTELEYAAAIVASGGSQDEAAVKVEQYRQGLIKQAEASGLSKDEAEKYIATLGLTPETVNTAIKMTGQEQAKAQAQEWIKILENTDGTGIPKEVISQIKAEVEAGSEAAVGRLQKIIQWLEQHNNTTFTYNVQTVTSRVDPGGGNNPPDQNASGGYIPTFTRSTLAEQGPEVVLNNRQAAKILWDQANGRGLGGGPGRSLVIQNHWYGDINGVDDFEERMAEHDRQLVAILGAN